MADYGHGATMWQWNPVGAAVGDIWSHKALKNHVVVKGIQVRITSSGAYDIYIAKYDTTGIEQDLL